MKAIRMADRGGAVDRNMKRLGLAVALAVLGMGARPPARNEPWRRIF